MKKILLVAGCGLFLGYGASAQRLCGSQIVQQAMIAHDPTFAQKIKDMKDAQHQIAENYRNNRSLAKSTAADCPIPVIFHYVLSAAEIIEIGGAAGIEKRVDSQIAVIERDFNRGNKDSTLIPAPFKSRYANVGIHFGLAHTDPYGNATPGYEIKSTSSDFSGESTTAYNSVKHTSLGGLDAWDNSVYLNLWVISTGSGNSVILGLTNPPSFADGSTGYTTDDWGVVLNYKAVGVRTSSSDVYVSGIDKGRTLTHELGHFFEIWHTWGDDNGHCPGQPGGYDDGIADTPPEADATYYDPSFPDFDGCADTATGFPAGIMFMNYMDYVNDKSMQMFTIDQAAVMMTNYNSESHSLTQHCSVLQYPLAVANVAGSAGNFNIFPNPSSGLIQVRFDQLPTDLKQISILNVVGQQVMAIDGRSVQNDNFSIDLSAMNKGIYIVRCTFASGTVTRKISLQ